MKFYLKKYLLNCLSLFVLIMIAGSFNSFLNNYQNSLTNLNLAATVFNPEELPADADPAYGFAWNDNVGWINFGNEGEEAEGQVYVSNNELYGYAWGENIGWISMNCENDGSCNTVEYAVTQNDSDGILTGYAWGENIGWINFAPDGGGVEISTNIAGINTFSGYAWGENIGWVSFSGESPVYGVETDWTAPEILISAISATVSQIYTNASTTFSATVTGRENTDINWSIVEGEIAGTISSEGVYTASSTAGTYTIVATADVDPTVSTSTTITVNNRGGGHSVTITNCSYTYSEWTECVNSEQTRIATPDPTECDNTSDELSRTCVMPITVSISPSATTTIYTGEKIQFSSTVSGTTTNNGVTWILTDEASGDLTDTGLYTAPATGGIFHVMVKSIADISKSAIATIDVRIKPACISYTYTDWSSCINNTMTRTASTTIPAICSGGIVATTTMECDIIPTATTTACTSYTYSDWSTCLNNKRTRTTLTSIPDNCLGGKKAITEEACTVESSTLYQTGENNNLPASDNTIPRKPSGGNNSENNTELLGIINISSFITDNVAILGTTTERIVLGAQKVLKSKTGSITAKTITTAGVVGGGVAVSGVLAMNGAVATDLLFLPFKLWGLLLSILGLKKRNRPWGTVYDSVTKQPIDPAYVTLKKVGSKDENTSITDLDGRYGFLVHPGKYVLSANKTNYIFPSKKLAGKNEDALYTNLYFGEEIDIQDSGTLISKNIPLDPIKFDWNEFVKGKKKLMKFYSRKEKIVKIMTDWIFRIGFVISLLSLFLVTAPYNYIIFLLYIVLALLRKFGFKQKSLGKLADKNGDPLSFAIIRVISPDLNTEITSKVADTIGRYYCLVPKGSYYVKIEKKNDDESYSEIFTSPVFSATNGIINKSFSI